MAGNGTIALELLEDLPSFDAVVIPWGGGGLSCGIAGVLRELAPRVRIYAVEIETAAPLAMTPLMKSRLETAFGTSWIILKSAFSAMLRYLLSPAAEASAM